MTEVKLNADWLALESALGGTRHVLAGTYEEMRAQFMALGGMIAQQWHEHGTPPDPDLKTRNMTLLNSLPTFFPK